MPTSSPVAMTVESDQPLEFRERLDRVQQRDAGALGLLYTDYGALVFKTALRITGRKPDAEDVTQDVFLRLPASLGGFTGSAHNFPGWIRRVAVRTSLMHLRGGKRRREVDVESVAGLLATPDKSAERMTIEVALTRIPAEHRTVFLLKEVEGYGHAEIGELLGISAANSEIRLHRARKALRELLRNSR